MSTVKTSPRKYAGYRNQELQRRIQSLVDRAGFRGMTAEEVAQHFDKETEAHQGDISGALAELHKGLILARLSEKRGTCKIYVHRDFLDGRKCEPQGRSDSLSKEEISRLVEIRDFMDYWFTVDQEGARFITDKTRAERYHKQFFARARRLFGDSV